MSENQKVLDQLVGTNTYRWIGISLTIVLGLMGVASFFKDFGIPLPAIILGMAVAFILTTLLILWRIALAIINLNEAQNSLQKTIEEQTPETTALLSEIKGLHPILEHATAEFRQNAEFVANGFIGLQKKSIEIEKIPVHQAPVRYSLHGHLPSHIRSSELSEETAKILYKGWTPERLVARYAELINERWKAHTAFIEDGGQCWEFYGKAGLDKYARGSTDFDSIVDPWEERLSRFERLRELSKTRNYNLRIFDQSLNSSILLRVPEEQASPLQGHQGAIQLDLRLPDSATNFEESIYGVYSQSPEVYTAYRKKVEALLNTSSQIISDQDVIEKMLNDWISAIKEDKKRKES